VTEQRHALRLNSLSLVEINLILAQLSDRLDKLEGLRGDPAFYADVDFQQKYLKNVAGMTEDVETATEYPSSFDKAISFNSTVVFSEPITLPIVSRLLPYPGLADLPTSGDFMIWNYAGTVRIVVNLNGTFWQAVLTQYTP